VGLLKGQLETAGPAGEKTGAAGELVAGSGTEALAATPHEVVIKPDITLAHGVVFCVSWTPLVTALPQKQMPMEFSHFG